MMIAGEEAPAARLALQLSHSRFRAVVWAEREDELGWLSLQNGAR